jgi:hypothetical protein
MSNTNDKNGIESGCNTKQLIESEKVINSSTNRFVKLNLQCSFRGTLSYILVDQNLDF